MAPERRGFSDLPTLGSGRCLDSSHTGDKSGVTTLGRHLRSLVAFLVWVMAFIPPAVQGWEVETHEAISREAAIDSSLDSSLKGSLELPRGLQTPLPDGAAQLTIEVWIAFGSRREDDFTIRPFGRFLHHLHQPLRPWAQAGLSDILSGTSSLIWAQTRDQQALGTGSWSWQETRDRFHLALKSEKKEDRDKFLAQTFRGLGHQIHLIQDAASVPHARNESHATGFSIEKWTFDRFQDKRREEFDQLLRQRPGIRLDPDLLRQPSDPVAPIAISKFIDADRYTGENPDLTSVALDGLDPSGQQVKLAAVGLAEYTNANFVHRDTIFTDTLPQTHKWWSPYPRRSSTNLATLALPEEVTAEDGQIDRVLYIRKERDGERIDHFLKPSYVATFADELGRPTDFRLQFQLDDKVYEDYVRLLLPRAVGYSIGLLDYFFRGTLDFEVRSSASASHSHELIITNTSAEPMQGTFTLYADDFTDVRSAVGGAAFNLTLGPGARSDPLPCNAPGQVRTHILVFNGRLGDEPGAVSSKVKPVPVNAFFVWHVRFYNDQFELVYLSSGGTFPCFFHVVGTFTSSGRHTGSRREYIFVAFVHEPNPPLPPLDIRALQLTARISPAPRPLFSTVTYDPFGGAGALAIVQGDGGRTCGQFHPFGPHVTPATPAAQIPPSMFPPNRVPPPNHYIVSAGGLWDSGVVASGDLLLTQKLTLTSFAQIEQIARDLHPLLRPALPSTAAVYAVAQFDLPNVDAWNVSTSNTAVWDGETAIAAASVAELWDLQGMTVRLGDGTIFELFDPPSQVRKRDLRIVFGREYFRKEERLPESFTLRFNPDSPFTPIREPLL